MLFAEDINTFGWVGVAGVIAALFTGLGTVLGLLLRSRREAHADSVRDYKEMYLTAQKERAEDKAAWRKEIHDLRDEHNAEKLRMQAEMISREKEADRVRSEDNRRCDERLDR